MTIAKRYFPGVVIFNTGSDSLPQALEAGRWAEDYGADAISVMTPYFYTDAPEDGLIKFFNVVSEKIDLPVLLYNFPKHTNNTITPEIAKSVKHFGIKDSSGDYSLIKETDNYFAGSSRSVVEAYKAGACGFISAQANHIPELYVQLEQLLKNGDFKKAEEQQEEIKTKCLIGTNEIGSIKERLSEIISGYPAQCRIPLS